MIIEKKLCAVIGVLAAMFFCSCNSGQVMKKAENQKVFIEPNVLSRLGDSVRFTINVLLPNAFLSRNETYSLVPKFVYGSEILRFDTKLKVRGDTLDPYEPVELQASYSMPFREGMEKGSMYAVAEIGKGKRSLPIGRSEELLSRGIVTTASLAQIGQYRGQDEIPVLGIWLSPDSLVMTGMGMDGWQALEDRLSGYSNLPFSSKSPFLEVLKGPGDWSFKKWKMTGIPHFPEINRSVLVRFERDVQQQIGKDPGISDIQLSILARNIRQGQVGADTLSERELAWAISREPGWKEQEQLLLAMEKVYPSAWVYSNLGMVFLNQANRTRSIQEKTNYWKTRFLPLTDPMPFTKIPSRSIILDWYSGFGGINSVLIIIFTERWRSRALTIQERFTRELSVRYPSLTEITGWQPFT